MLLKLYIKGIKFIIYLVLLKSLRIGEIKWDLTL